MFKGLRKYAAACGALWVTTKLYHDWALVVSMTAGMATSGLAFWEWGTQGGYTPVVLVLVFTTTCIIWMIHGARALLRRGVPTKAKISFDYAYGLAFQRIDISMDDTDEARYIQFGIVWKNAAPTAIKLHIDYLRVVIGDKTVVDDQSSTRDGILSRDCEMTGFHPAFSKPQVQDLPTKASGIVEYQVRYGHPEQGFARLATARLKVTFRLDTGSSTSIIDVMNDEGLAV